MKGMPWPKGLVTALVTPLQNDEVHRASLETLIDYQIANGASGFVVSGGTGEHSTLAFGERSRLIRDAVQITRGRIPVIAATGCLSTRDTIRLSQDATEAGAAGLLVASPYGEPINWRERYAFYEALAGSVSVPIMIYNTPPAGLLSFEQVQQLAKLRNISGIKDSSGNPELMGDLVMWAKEIDFGVYVGKDSFLYEAISTGADGAIFGAANFIPAELARLIGLVHSGAPTSQALELWTRLRPLLRIMEQASNYVGLCKAGCKLRGLDVGTVRQPYLMPESREIALLTQSLKQLG
jgi:4-hydroxy-tetrahydrodipicolinate synthase